MSRLPVLQTNLTSSTFSSSRVGSSTIPGMMSVTPTLTTQPQPRRPRLLELPFRPPRAAQQLRMRSWRHAGASLCPSANHRACVRPGSCASALAPPTPPGCHGETANRETPESPRLQAKGRRHAVHGERIHWGICRWEVRAHLIHCLENLWEKTAVFLPLKGSCTRHFHKFFPFNLQNNNFW